MSYRPISRETPRSARPPSLSATRKELRPNDPPWPLDLAAPHSRPGAPPWPERPGGRPPAGCPRDSGAPSLVELGRPRRVGRSGRNLHWGDGGIPPPHRPCLPVGDDHGSAELSDRPPLAFGAPGGALLGDPRLSHPPHRLERRARP